MIEQQPLTTQQLRVLMGSLNSNRVSHRSQGGRQLSYLEAWDVKATLIRVFGFGNFSAETIETKVLRFDEVPKREGNGTNFRVTAMATVRLTIHQTGAVYTESAASSQTGPDVGEATDFAIKTAESDALKRAATYLGTQFGLSLYDNGATNDVIRVNFAPDQQFEREDVNPQAAGQVARATGQQQRAQEVAQQVNQQAQQEGSDASVQAGVPEQAQQFADTVGATIVNTGQEQ